MSPDLVTTAILLLYALSGVTKWKSAQPNPRSLGVPTAATQLLVLQRSLPSKFETHDLPGRARESKQLFAILTLLELESVRVCGRGAMMAIELINGEVTNEIAAACKKQGILILTCGLDGNVIRLLPALTIPEHLLREGLEILTTEIREALA